MGASIGKVLIVLGVVLVVFGAILYSGGGKYFSWLGRLPGDIRIEGEHSRFYFPITTSIVVSIVVSLLLIVLSRLR